MASEFRNLDAYTRSVSLANDLRSRVLVWPSFDRWSLGIQLMRSADSIGANIAEGLGRWQLRDQRRFLFIARGSLYETEHWIACGEERGLLPVATADRLVPVARALHGLIKKRQS